MPRAIATLNPIDRAAEADAFLRSLIRVEPVELPEPPSAPDWDEQTRPGAWADVTRVPSGER